MFPSEINNFIEKFSKLPSIGPRMATRLAFYLSERDPRWLSELAQSIVNLSGLSLCEMCFGTAEKGKSLCSVCKNSERNKKIVAIVEKQTDVFTIEKSGGYRGSYLVLGELKSDGMLEENQKKRLSVFSKRIETEHNGKIEEIIIALGPNTFGDFVASIIKQEFKEKAERITRIGRGIPTGGQIEFADEETLRNSLENRK